MISLSSRSLEKDDYEFFKEIIIESNEWQNEECNVEDLQTYLLSYKMFNGEWRIWKSGDKPVGVSYVMEWSPANEKPWIGTILVHPHLRMKGFGKSILAEIGSELSRKGHKALFVGCPIQQDKWLQFLGKCGFEQFKVEFDEYTSKEFMIAVKPL
ncbi:GNAT family N-acetyltransferase [Metabacillus bambusae]|uniref:GNAT family N-acetyltransferase n=1 Tax=Metabacillus bambusae TaxID=2795218 RepID=A0ABS3MX25_9BACI|nr:GNAT family N-acetyltransferase [Metabacillus bambusae]MBO1510573.1 GNAT family N-acetyltransferase [Metabacillus bambusae]